MVRKRSAEAKTGKVGTSGDSIAPAALVALFGDPVPAKEVETWVAMPPPQRAKALQRVASLQRFIDPTCEITAAKAAADAGVTTSRFYQMARLWAKTPSLSSLGAYASSTRSRQRLDPAVANSIQALTPQIVRQNKGATVSRMTQVLLERLDLPADEVPSKNTLRLFIERELRRVREAGDAGHEVLFDCSASSLTRSDGSPHILFLIIDSGTRLILGHSVGRLDKSRAAYGVAAADARTRIGGGSFRGCSWAGRLERSQMVPGHDRHEIEVTVAALKEKFGGAAPQLLTSAKPFGRYIREHLGLKLGPIRLIPSRTGAPLTTASTTSSDSVAGLSEQDARARVELEVASHNKAIVKELNVRGSPTPPLELEGLLDALAKD